MISSTVAKIVAGSLLISFTALRLVQADGLQATPGKQPALNCQQMMDKAKSMVVNMPAGVEKMAAQKEIASAQLDLNKGAEPECKTRIRNAEDAMKAHGTN